MSNKSIYLTLFKYRLNSFLMFNSVKPILRITKAFSKTKKRRIPIDVTQWYAPTNNSTDGDKYQINEVAVHSLEISRKTPDYSHRRPKRQGCNG